MTGGTAPPEPRDRPAGPVGLSKPLDVGNGQLAASFSADGDWLSVGHPHPTHGYVELSGLPAFDESWRGDPVAVRRYRSWMTEGRFGFLRLDLPGPARTSHAGIDLIGRATWSRAGPGWAHVATAWAVPDRPLVVQRHALRSRGGPLAVTLRLRGEVRRAAFAEITEVSPLPPLHTATEIRLDGPSVTLVAADLPATAVVHVDSGPRPVAWTAEPGGARLLLELDGDGDGAELTVAVSLLARRDSSPPPRNGVLPYPSGWLGSGPHDHRADDLLDLIAAGAARYILGCTALTVGPAERTLLTDHRILPLSWTRDAYYQALLLLTMAARAPAARPVVAEHLRWLWGPGRPEAGIWQRSHLPHGRPKDLAMQADQQLYPLLELLDFRQWCDAWPAPPGDVRSAPGGAVTRAWGALVADAWQRLPRASDGLLTGAENPADDVSELPYALSTQILYWYAAARLATWAAELGLDPGPFGTAAERLPGLVRRHFAHPGPFGEQWAYESDLRSGRRLYQDANDLPTAFAPRYGFCAPDDPQWLATMRYAFSVHNRGHTSGAYGGLGSVHTPGTWPLGDAQQLAVAWTRRDTRCSAAVLARLRRVVGVDGLLPETYHPDTGVWLARHWFAWPAAVIGALHRGGIRAAGQN